MPEGLACNPSSGAESKEVTVSATGKNEEIAQKKFDIVFMTTGETVVRDTLHVTQNGAEPRINVQERLNIDTNGNEASLHVNSNTTWTAQVSYTDGSGWLRGIVTSNYGIKELDMKVSAEKNESIYSREAKITFTADGVTPVTVTVTQSGTTASTSVTPSKLDFEATGDDTGKEISVTSNEVWTVSLSPIVPSDSPYWCHVSPMQEEGSGSVKVTVEDNESTETERSATIIITGTTSKEHSEVTVTQSKKEIVLRVNDSSTPSAITISADGTGQQVYVESNTTWTVSTSDNWLTCTPNKYNGSTWITVSAEANKLTTEKKGKLVFTADDKKEVELTVIQKGDKIRFEVEPTELFFGHTNAPRQWVSVDCNVNYIVNPGSSSWCDYELDSDKGFYVSVEDNPNYTPRTTIITVDAPDSNKPAVEIIVKQEGKTNIAVTPFGPDEDWDNK